MTMVAMTITTVKFGSWLGGKEQPTIAHLDCIMDMIPFVVAFNQIVGPP